MNLPHDVALATDKVERARPHEAPAPEPYLLGDLLTDYLTQLGIEVAFGIPGGGIEPVLDALARSERRGGIRPVIARHESGAAFMADGYARETGRLGVCFSTMGPGATNMLTGVATAYENRIPLLVLTAQTNLETMGRRAAQESSCTSVNTVGMFDFCTGYNSMVSHPAQFEPKLISAVLAAVRERKPAHLALPRDLMKGVSPQPKPSVDLIQLIQCRQGMDSAGVESLVAELKQSRRTVFLLGEGCDGMVENILPLAETLDALIIASPHAAGLIDARVPRYRGVFGLAGHSSARETLQGTEVDTILAVGCQFDECASSNWNADLLLNSRMIQVDSNPENFATAPRARLHVLGDLAEIFRKLRSQLADSKVVRPLPTTSATNAAPILGREDNEVESLIDDPKSWRSEAVPIKPQRVMHELTTLFPTGTKFLADSGNSLTWSVHYLFPKFPCVAQSELAAQPSIQPGCWKQPASSRFLPIMKFAPMGWAIGAAVGTALSNRDNAVVCITGDGSLLMNGQELTVAKEQGLNTVFVILNDSALGMVMHGQRMGGAEQVGIDMPFVDFAAFARSMGVEAFTITRPEEFSKLNVESMCRKGAPTLVDIRIDREEVPPMGLRVAALHARPE